MEKSSDIAQTLHDESLMKLAIKGESWAFEQLYDRYAPKLLKYVYRFTDEKSQAEDFIQETFLKLLEKPQAFDTERKFSTWIYTVAGNVCRNQLRNAGRRKLLNEQILFETNQGEMQSRIDVKQLKEKLQTAFNTLNQKEQEVFVLRFELELSMKEISEIVGIPEGSVKSCLFYLLKKLAPHLKEFRYE